MLEEPEAQVGSRRNWWCTVAVVAVVVTSLGAVDGAAHAATPGQAQSSAASPVGEYTPLTPVRILDTRDGTGGHSGKLGAGQQFDVAITDIGGVPTSGVSAVVVNATVTGATSASYLTVWPQGLPRPVISNLNYGPGQTIANLVTVAVQNGGVSVYNNAGSTHVIFDVVGYYADDTGTAGSRFHTVAPSRLFDTRNGGGPKSSGQVVQQQVLGTNGIPATGVTAVVLNVTVTQPTASGFVTVYPDDVPQPTASNINYAAGSTVPNLVEVRVPASGVVDLVNITNGGGSVQLLADVVGYYDGDKTTEAGRLATDQPERLVDTRTDMQPPLGCVPAGATFILEFPDADQTDSIIFNVTVTQPTATGFLTSYPMPPPPPLASTLNFVPGQTVPNLAIVKLGPEPDLGFEHAAGFYNSAGCTHLILDVFGLFTNANAVAPATASSAGAHGELGETRRARI